MNTLHHSFLYRPFNLENNSIVLSQLKTVAQARLLKVNDSGHFIEIGVIHWIWEQFKEILGIDNRTNSEFLRYRFLQLVSESAEKGLLTKSECSESNRPIHLAARKMGIIPSPRFSQNPHNPSFIFQSIIQTVVNSEQAKPDFKQLLSNYRFHHFNELVPHSIVDRIRLAWQKKQQNEEEFGQSEFDFSEQQEEELKEFPDQPQSEIDQNNQVFQPITSQKNPSVSDLLIKLADTEQLADQLEKLALLPHKQESYKDLYLKIIFTQPSESSNHAKLIQDWVSDTLSLSTNWSIEKAKNFDQGVQFLNFKNAFAIIAAGYRLTHIIKNEEERQLNPSLDFIKQCQNSLEFFRWHLEKLIQEHPSDYHALNLTAISATSPSFQFDLTVPYQFLYELTKQQKLNLEKSKSTFGVASWARVGFLSLGILTGGALYAIKQLTSEPPPPPPPISIATVLEKHLWTVVNFFAVSLLLGGTFAFFCRSKSHARNNILPRDPHDLTGREDYDPNPSGHRPPEIPDTGSPSSGLSGETMDTTPADDGAGLPSTNTLSNPGTNSAALSPVEKPTIPANMTHVISLLKKSENKSRKDYIYSDGRINETTLDFDYESPTCTKIYGNFSKLNGLIIKGGKLGGTEGIDQIRFTVFKKGTDYYLITNIFKENQNYINLTRIENYIKIDEIETLLAKTQITENEIIVHLQDPQGQEKLEQLKSQHESLIEKFNIYLNFYLKFNKEKDESLYKFSKLGLTLASFSEAIVKKEIISAGNFLREVESQFINLEEVIKAIITDWLKEANELLEFYTTLQKRLSESPSDAREENIEKFNTQLRQANDLINGISLNEDNKIAKILEAQQILDDIDNIAKEIIRQEQYNAINNGFPSQDIINTTLNNLKEWNNDGTKLLHNMITESYKVVKQALDDLKDPTISAAKLKNKNDLEKLGEKISELTNLLSSAKEFLLFEIKKLEQLRSHYASLSEKFNLYQNFYIKFKKDGEHDCFSRLTSTLKNLSDLIEKKDIISSNDVVNEVKGQFINLEEVIDAIILDWQKEANIIIESFQTLKKRLTEYSIDVGIEKIENFKTQLREVIAFIEDLSPNEENKVDKIFKAQERLDSVSKIAQEITRQIKQKQIDAIDKKLHMGTLSKTLTKLKDQGSEEAKSFYQKIKESYDVVKQELQELQKPTIQLKSQEDLNILNKKIEELKKQQSLVEEFLSSKIKKQEKLKTKQNPVQPKSEPKRRKKRIPGRKQQSSAMQEKLKTQQNQGNPESKPLRKIKKSDIL